MLSVTPGKVAPATAASVALLMMVNWLRENCVPLPLKTRVRVRLGGSTIIPGGLPAKIGDPGAGTSFSASTIKTPALKLPADTPFVMNARYARPLVFVPLEE